MTDNFRYVLKRYREEKGLTQQELSDLIGVDVSFVGQMETGKKWPNINMFSRIAYALDIPAAELMRALEMEASESTARK